MMRGRRPGLVRAGRRVGEGRRSPTGRRRLPPTGAAAELAPAMRKLMTVDARSLCRPTGPLDGHDEWVAAFERAGTTLAHLAAEGGLTRGLRAVIAHHVIFHANRAGLLPDDQSALFNIAREAVMGSSDNTASSTEGNADTTSVSAVNTDTIATPEADADGSATPWSTRSARPGTPARPPSRPRCAPCPATCSCPTRHSKTPTPTHRSTSSTTPTARRSPAPPSPASSPSCWTSSTPSPANASSNSAPAPATTPRCSPTWSARTDTSPPSTSTTTSWKAPARTSPPPGSPTSRP